MTAIVIGSTFRIWGYPEMAGRGANEPKKEESQEKKEDPEKS